MSVNCDPQAMVTTATPLQAIPDGFQLSQSISLLAQWAGVTVDANALATAASSLQGLSGSEADVLIALLAKKAAGSTDANTLSKLASCLDCIPEGARMMVLNSILCQIVQASPVDGTKITLPGDTDTTTFFCYVLAACTAGKCNIQGDCLPGSTIVIPMGCVSGCGINQTIVDSTFNLVTALKAAGLWTVLDVIYPFIGGNAIPCSFNLKDASKYRIQWSGAGLSFSASGVISDNTQSAYGDSTFFPLTAGGNFSLNSASMGVYFKTSAVTGGWLCGVSSGAGINPSYIGTQPAGPMYVYGMNEFSPKSAPINAQNGNIMLSRIDAASSTLYQPDGSTTASGQASIAIDNHSLAFVGKNNAGSPNASCTGTYAFGFAGGGLTAGQVATLSGIITTFETSLGRN